MQQIYEFIANKQTFSRVFMLFLCCLLLSTSTFAQNSSARITIHKWKNKRNCPLATTNRS